MPMSAMLRDTVLVAALAAASLLIACSGAETPAPESATSTLVSPSPAPEQTAPPVQSPVVTATGDDAYSADARYYASKFGVSEAEAMERLKLQNAIDPSLLEVEGKTLAVWLEHEPEMHLVVSVVGEDVGMEAAREAAKSMPVPVEFRFGAPYTQEQINEIADAALESLGPDAGAAGIGYLPMEGHIWLSLQPFSRYANQDASMSAILTAQFGFPFSVETSTTVAGDG